MFYYLAVPMANDLEALSFVISPQATATSVVKILVSAVCVSFGYATVMALKEGPLATYEGGPHRTELGSRCIFFVPLIWGSQFVIF